MEKKLTVFGLRPDSLTQVAYQHQLELFYKDVVGKFVGRARRKDYFISISSVHDSDILLLEAIATEFEMDFSANLEFEYTKADLRLARFVRLRVEGEPVDSPKQVTAQCKACGCIDLGMLPTPFVVRDDFLAEVSEYWGEGALDSRRDIYSASSGIFVVSSRFFAAITDLCLSEIDAHSVYTASGNLTDYTAIRPKSSWGVYVDHHAVSICAECGQPRECRAKDNSRPHVNDPRLCVAPAVLPESEIVATESWYGDLEADSDVWQDIFISGRLYMELHKLKFKGLIAPSEPVWMDGVLVGH